jgi:hypothetical protein
MPIDLSYSPEVAALVEQTAAFTRGVVLPVEDDHHGDIDTSGEPGQRGGATMFLSPADAPGLQVGRHLDTADKAMIGGNAKYSSTICSYPIPQYSAKLIAVLSTHRCGSGLLG